MDISAKRRVVEKLIRQTLEKLDIEAEILPYDKFHSDEYMFELNIDVDSSKYHKAGPNYVKDYNEYIDYIDDYIGGKLKSYGLDDFYVNAKYKHKNFEWAQDTILKILKDLTKNSKISEERLLKSFVIGKGRCYGDVSRSHLNVCIQKPFSSWFTTTNLGSFFVNHPLLEDFFISYDN
jgi:hypothetical protein